MHHIHADAVTLLVIGAGLIFWQGTLTALAAWLLAMHPASAMAQGLAVIVGI